jgi:Phage tail tube protein, GTA-gp10
MIDVDLGIVVSNANLGEGYYDLALPLGCLENLEEIRGVGCFDLVRRVAASQWYARDIFETIRLGLIGGGMSPTKALDITTRNVTSGYLAEYAGLATEVLGLAIQRREHDPVGEQSGEETTETPQTMTEESSSPKSMAQQPKSGSRRAKSAE